MGILRLSYRKNDNFKAKIGQKYMKLYTKNKIKIKYIILFGSYSKTVLIYDPLY